MNRTRAFRESQEVTSNTRRVRSVVKYAVLTACGIVLFLVVHARMSEVRGHGSPGGEMFFPLLPVLWWLISRTAKDWAADVGDLFAEVSTDEQDDRV